MYTHLHLGTVYIMSRFGGAGLLLIKEGPQFRILVLAGSQSSPQFGYEGIGL
jgi:hypothetical protein